MPSCECEYNWKYNLFLCSMRNIAKYGGFYTQNERIWSEVLGGYSRVTSLEPCWRLRQRHKFLVFIDLKESSEQKCLFSCCSISWVSQSGREFHGLCVFSCVWANKNGSCELSRWCESHTHTHTYTHTHTQCVSQSRKREREKGEKEERVLVHTVIMTGIDSHTTRCSPMLES